jgi:hypothetical protein
MDQPDDDFRPPTRSGVGPIVTLGLVLVACGLVVLLIVGFGGAFFAGKVDEPAERVDKPAELKPARLEGQAVVD